MDFLTYFFIFFYFFWPLKFLIKKWHFKSSKIEVLFGPVSTFKYFGSYIYLIQKYWTFWLIFSFFFIFFGLWNSFIKKWNFKSSKIEVLFGPVSKVKYFGSYIYLIQKYWTFSLIFSFFFLFFLAFEIPL